MKKISLLTCAVITLCAIALSVTVTFVVMRVFPTAKSGTSNERVDLSDNADTTPTGSLEDISEKLAELDGSFREHYIGEMPDYDELEKGVILGYLSATGDRHTYYYTAEEYEEMTRESMGDSEGIGISVIWNSDEYAIEILNIFPDSPASKTDLAIGDLIVAVGIGDDAEDVSGLGYEKALSMLRGKSGTNAEFKVLRGEELIDYKIARGHYELQTVTYRVSEKDPTVGIIDISEFERVTPTQFKNAVEALEKAGAPNLIVDLRNNPGGDRDAILDVLDYILPEGPLFRLLQPDGSVKVVDTSDARCIDNPMVVLVNGSTASAAELFTAAMRDYDRAKIVGTTTYGKGSMQTFYRLSDGSVFKTTSDLYYPPYSDNYDGVGIAPDVEVELDEELQKINPYKIKDSEDNQLAAAFDTLMDEIGK
jgi:carboxyl-terminal processing protease